MFLINILSNAKMKIIFNMIKISSNMYYTKLFRREKKNIINDGELCDFYNRDMFAFSSDIMEKSELKTKDIYSNIITLCDKLCQTNILLMVYVYKSFVLDINAHRLMTIVVSFIFSLS
jgi:hypothetical protein